MNDRLTFGLTGEQEDRYRSDCLPADLDQARICALLILVPIVAFLFNDYRFFGLSWQFYGLAALRLGLCAHTMFLVGYTGRASSYRSYDRAALAWGLVLVLSVIVIDATRPADFLAHAVVVVVMVFLFSLGIPNRFINQVILSSAVALGEAAIILVCSQPPSSQATLAILTSVFLASGVALSASWQFNSYRRRVFAAGEKEQAAVEALRESESRMRRAKEDWEQTFDSVPDFVAILDVQQRVVRANRPMAERLGVTTEQCVGLHCYEAIHGTTGPPEFCPHTQTCRDRREHTVEVHEPRLGGYFLVSTTPRFDEQGRFTGTVHVARDITERKQAEESLRRTAEDLARSNKDLEQFAYVASHDLKEPLRMVTGFMSLLKDRCQGKLDAKSDEYIAVASDAALRMQGLNDDLLTYSRAGRGEMTERTDVGDVLDRALRSLTVSIKESGAAITRDPLPTITSNPLELAQVFQNLVGNAVKFKGQRKPEIHIGAQRQPGCWLFTVRDNGIGIDQQFADRIFMIFQRLHTREQYPGTGIGLAICKKIVQRHGGRIWMESQPGVGSTFCFTISDEGKDKDAAG